MLIIYITNRIYIVETDIMLTLKIITPPSSAEIVQDKENIDITSEEIRMDQTPIKRRWTLIPLYKISVNTNMLFWQIGFDGINRLEINQGYDDEIIHTDYITMQFNDSIAFCAKSTERDTSTVRDIQQQALREARRCYKLKYEEGYRPAGAAAPSLAKGMKGYQYKRNLVKIWPVYTQPKLNGIRMLCQDIGGTTLTMKSWLNNQFTHLTHLEQDLKDFFVYLPRYATLDGELYNHNMDFTTLTSAIKTVNTIHPKLHDVQYWIFDINYEDSEGTPFEKRYTLLINAYGKYIQDKNPINNRDEILTLPAIFAIVPTQIANNHEEVLKQHNEHVAMGYEGIMIKKITNGYPPDSKQYRESLYRSGKGNHILKYKEFIDEEVIILGITGGTEKENFIFNVEDKRGNNFPIRMRGHFDPQNLYSVIGKEVTIRYRELSMGGIPILPVGIAIRDYE